VKAIIVADGDVSTGDLGGLATPARGEPPPLVVAADGGALKAELLGLVPDVVVGDLDSLSPERVARLRAAGVELIAHPPDKDESDTQLALLEAIRRGARQLVLIGALGGLRLDHTLANLLLLSLPELDGCDILLVDGAATLRVMGGGGQPVSLELHGSAGDLVSLLPLSDVVEGVTTSGLVYALHGEPLRQGYSRGLSNVMQAERAEIELRSGRLAVVHTVQQATEANHE
jgi:thiamine pyrophosphokinase